MGGEIYVRIYIMCITCMYVYVISYSLDNYVHMYNYLSVLCSFHMYIRWFMHNGQQGVSFHVVVCVLPTYLLHMHNVIATYCDMKLTIVYCDILIQYFINNSLCD